MDVRLPTMNYCHLIYAVHDLGLWLLHCPVRRRHGTHVGGCSRVAFACKATLLVQAVRFQGVAQVACPAAMYSRNADTDLRTAPPSPARAGLVAPASPCCAGGTHGVSPLDALCFTPPPACVEASYRRGLKLLDDALRKRQLEVLFISWPPRSLHSFFVV